MKLKFWIIMTSLPVMLALTAGCGPGEARIRDIVKEELGRAMTRNAITDVNAIGPYSPAQKVGNFLFVSGQIGINPETGELEAKDLESETKQVLNNLMKVLKKAGYDSSDVLSTTVYLTDMKKYAEMNNIYGGYFEEGNYPARVTVQVAALPRSANVEISAIAYRAR